MRGSRDLARSLTTLKARYLVVNFIGLAMIGAVFVYAGVVELLKWKLAPFAGFAKLDPHTVALLKYAFLALAAAPERARALAEGARRRAVEHYSLERYEKQLWEVYAGLLGNETPEAAAEA